MPLNGIQYFKHGDRKVTVEWPFKEDKFYWRTVEFKKREWESLLPV